MGTNALLHIQIHFLLFFLFLSVSLSYISVLAYIIFEYANFSSGRLI
jgi:hypothetical protein